LDGFTWFDRLGFERRRRVRRADQSGVWFAISGFGLTWFDQKAARPAGTDWPTLAANVGGCHNLTFGLTNLDQSIRSLGTIPTKMRKIRLPSPGKLRGGWFMAG
jgi:hypothetical protein